MIFLNNAGKISSEILSCWNVNFAQYNFGFLITRQDFETPGMQRYIFRLNVEQSLLQTVVTLLIVNIDDNAPIIRALDACVVPVSIPSSFH
jgi:hypothetical protein